MSGYPRARLTTRVNATANAPRRLVAVSSREPRRREKRAIASSPARKLTKYGDGVNEHKLLLVSTRREDDRRGDEGVNADGSDGCVMPVREGERTRQQSRSP